MDILTHTLTLNMEGYYLYNKGYELYKNKNNIDYETSNNEHELLNKKIDDFSKFDFEKEFIKEEQKMFHLTDEQREQISLKYAEHIKSVLSEKPDSNSIMEAIQYSYYDALVGVNENNTFMKQFFAMNDGEKESIINFMRENKFSTTTPYGEKEIAELFLQDNISISEFKAKWIDYSQKTMKYANEHPSDENMFSRKYNPNMPNQEIIPDDFSNDKSGLGIEQDKQAEIERNNRMLMRKYNGAKSLNINDNAKNEILKTFFEEFLKNNNPLKFLEFMKKTDIKA